MQNHIVHAGQLERIGQDIGQGPQWEVIVPDSPEGLPVGANVVSQRPARWRGEGRPDRIVIHWGGTDPHHLYTCLDGKINGDGSEDHISTHFGISGTHVFQYADTKLKCWHAGWANGRAIGMDVAQWCVQTSQSGKPRRCFRCGTKDHCKYGVDYRDVPIVDNPSKIGPRKVLQLHPATAYTMRGFVQDLCEVMGMPFRLAERDRKYSKAEYNDDDGPTVYGHHNISTSGKMDYAPWFDAIWG